MEVRITGSEIRRKEEEINQGLESRGKESRGIKIISIC